MLKERNDFLKDLELCGNPDLIYWYNEMLKNNMPGAVEDIKNEMVKRFLFTDWSSIEELQIEMQVKE